jgi:putative transposase
VSALLRKTLLSTNLIESMFSLVRHSERNIKRTRGSAMLQPWLGTVLLYCEKQFRRVKGFAEMAQVMQLS